MATNPYLDANAKAITGQVTSNLQRNILPGISSGAAQAGGYGGSRQGVLEANALKDANQGLSNSLSGMYGQAYAQDQQNDLTRTGMANQFALGNRGLDNQLNLGLGGLAMQGQGQMQNFYTQQRGLDQSGAALGASLYGQGNSGMVGQGTGIQGIGNTQQQAPWMNLNNAGNMFSQFSGLGGSQTQTQGGNMLGGAIGGGLAGVQFGRNLGFGGGGAGAAPWDLSWTNRGSGD